MSQPAAGLKFWGEVTKRPAYAPNLAMNKPRPQPTRDAIAALEALASALAGLEPALERWLISTTDAPAERERARRAAMQLRLQASRIVAVLDATPGAAESAAWHGQERRSPNRARNIARLPERPSGAVDDPATLPQDWEPF